MENRFIIDTSIDHRTTLIAFDLCANPRFLFQIAFASWDLELSCAHEFESRSCPVAFW